jgi:hypothetical protein
MPTRRSAYYGVRDHLLHTREYDTLDQAVADALRRTTTDDMSTLILPSGEEYTLLRRPEVPK